MPGESITRAGVILYGLASAACGIMDCIWGGFDASHQPIQAFGDHIPGATILAYITGASMIAAGLAILLRRSARAGGGALVYASLAPRSSSWPRTILITRWIFALCAINFGLNHLDAVADNLSFVPKWMPLGQGFWVILTGICFVLAGLGLLSGFQDVLAARLLALMFLAFNVFALPPFIFAEPRDHAAWGGNAFNLALVGATWIFAHAIAAHHRSTQNQRSAKPSLA